MEEQMKKFLIINLMLLFAHTSRAVSIDFIAYDDEYQVVDLYISYYTYADILPEIEFSDEFCEESFPETCFIGLAVHGETWDYAEAEVYVEEIITYDVAHIYHPALLVFQTEEGSQAEILVGN